jgi:hypothetical protein
MGRSQLKSFPGQVHEVEKVGKWLYWEADEVALDIEAGRKENAIMPHVETIRVMEMLDEVRR